MYVRVRVCSNKSKSTVNFPFPLVDDAKVERIIYSGKENHRLE